LKSELKTKESVIDQNEEDKAQALHTVTQDFKTKIADLNKKIRMLSAADAEVQTRV
jgi:hypothetical protein